MSEMFLYKENVVATTFKGIFYEESLPTPAVGDYAIQLGDTDKFCYCTTSGTWNKVEYLGTVEELPTASSTYQDMVVALIQSGVVTYEVCDGESWTSLTDNVLYHLSRNSVGTILTA